MDKRGKKGKKNEKKKRTSIGDSNKDAHLLLIPFVYMKFKQSNMILGISTSPSVNKVSGDSA